ncbi:DUF6968 family protein [Xanthomonas campestris]|uniref:DUF6968 family protein n=1 Tax=Xanthomonas campestris TaxID=339 RepID=UPI00101AE71D|nr:hypothetical protein [Xanthomonas campestris]MCD0252395.1 hypothetical protein [Xanthomonas campestris pv. campestris]MEB1261208.1 hypothetical protein [Xanthomonas campestris pv. campestris]MEB1303860.1 hypothetical protein [Xanthomonas campestris pv. campestris]MEB1312327.1 hypothetical protein [Xanthomonas campestris pv. campestris]MEB1322299.1 hypothetical protein [Xanthomonas campestris pv. campestris]
MKENQEHILKRTLKAGSRTIVVTINKPSEEGEDFRCQYTIDDGESRRLSYAMGMDSVQAMQLAMKKIIIDLLALGEKIGNPINWLEDGPEGSGF